MGGQYHFYMETHVTKALPTEDGFEIKCATQWQDIVQTGCANILGWDNNRQFSFDICSTRQFIAVPCRSFSFSG